MVITPSHTKPIITLLIPSLKNHINHLLYPAIPIFGI